MATRAAEQPRREIGRAAEPELEGSTRRVERNEEADRELLSRPRAVRCLRGRGLEDVEAELRRERALHRRRLPDGPLEHVAGVRVDTDVGEAVWAFTGARAIQSISLLSSLFLSDPTSTIASFL